MKQKCEHHAECMKKIQAIIDGEASTEQIEHFKSHNLEECMPCIEAYHLEKCVKESLQQKITKICCPESIIEAIKSKLSFATVLFILILHQKGFAQKPTFKILNNPQFHAGCFIGESEKTIANLSHFDEAGNDAAIFNLNEKDEYFKPIKGTKDYPDAFQNGTTKIYIKEKFIKKDSPESCLYYNKYTIKLVYKNKRYFYQYTGFCGC